MVISAIDKSSFKAAAAVAGPLGPYENQIKNWQQQFSSSSPQYALAAALIAEIEQLSQTGKINDLRSWFQTTYLTHSSQPIFGDIYYAFPGLTSDQMASLCAIIGLDQPTAYPFDQFLWELSNYPFNSTDGQRIATQIIHFIMERDASSLASTTSLLKSWSQQNIFNAGFYNNYPNISAADMAELQDLLGTVAPQKPTPTLPQIRAYFEDWALQDSGPRKEVGKWVGVGFLNGTVRSVADLQYFVKADSMYKMFPGITFEDVQAIYDEVGLSNPPTK